MSVFSQRQQAALAAAGAFKDWSNYLLVTTVAALGWVATQPVWERHSLKLICIWSFSASIIFGMLTLALIPTIIDRIAYEDVSFYFVKGRFQLFYVFGPLIAVRIKWFCWPQHVSFIVGILAFALGAETDCSGGAGGAK